MERTGSDEARSQCAAVVVIVSTWHARTGSDEARSQCGRSEGWRLDACSNSAWSNNKSHNNGIIIIIRMMMTMIIARLEVREEGHGVVTRHVAEQLTQRMQVGHERLRAARGGPPRGLELRTHDLPRR